MILIGHIRFMLFFRILIFNKFYILQINESYIQEYSNASAFFFFCPFNDMLPFNCQLLKQPIPVKRIVYIVDLLYCTVFILSFSNYLHNVMKNTGIQIFINIYCRVFCVIMSVSVYYRGIIIYRIVIHQICVIKCNLIRILTQYENNCNIISEVQNWI